MAENKKTDSHFPWDVRENTWSKDSLSNNELLNNLMDSQPLWEKHGVLSRSSIRNTTLKGPGSLPTIPQKIQDSKWAEKKNTGNRRCRALMTLREWEISSSIQEPQHTPQQKTGNWAWVPRSLQKSNIKLRKHLPHYNVSFSRPAAAGRLRSYQLSTEAQIACNFGCRTQPRHVVCLIGCTVSLLQTALQWDSWFQTLGI